MVDRINLCMLAPEFLPVWGGVGSYTVELLKSLPDNVDIHVVTLKRNIPGFSGEDYNSEKISAVLKRPIEIHYVSTSSETFSYNLAFQIACLRKVPMLHTKCRFDIIHSHLCHMPDVFLKLLVNLPVPTVLTVHGTIQSLRAHALMARSIFGGLENSENSILNFYPAIEFLQQKYVRRVDKLIAVSKATKNLALDDLKVDEERIDIVYNGVDTELFLPSNGKQREQKYLKHTVVYIGRVIAKKGINVLIKSIPEVLKSFPDTRFIFVGGGNVSFYREMLLDMGINQENFSFIGHLGYYERSAILQEATVFVNASFFENFSISILEAMSCGCAVIASNVGGNPEVIESGKNGLLFPAFDEKKLAEAIISLLNDEDFNSKLGTAARQTIERSFSSTKCAKHTHAVYRDVLLK
jgi:glycosyltransferase involved in cell wall biosynthesis